MTANQFRRIALGMSGAVEGSHMDHPDFRANGRIFATLHPDNVRGMVKLTPEQQDEFMRNDPDIFEPASGAWGRQGCTMVRLAKADEATVGEAMTLAWQAVPSGRAAKAQGRACGAGAQEKKGSPMSDPDHNHTPEEERQIREAALDETIAESFPASDPPSTIPNPDDDELLEDQPTDDDQHRTR